MTRPDPPAPPAPPAPEPTPTDPPAPEPTPTDPPKPAPTIDEQVAELQRRLSIVEARMGATIGPAAPGGGPAENQDANMAPSFPPGPHPGGPGAP